MAQAIHQKTARRGPATELWHVGILHRPMDAVMRVNALHDLPATWLPMPRRFAFIADPFGLKRGDTFTLLVEALDYRRKKGEIHYYRYDADWNLVAQGCALKAPWHLSYPFLIEDQGEIYLLPEAHKSGTLTLYRATHFPARWEPVAELLDLPAIDASVISYGGRWWMFFALPGAQQRAMRELHIAHADRLQGPWRLHAGNPVRVDAASARPGGTPFVHDGQLYLPTQDCMHGYGTAVTLLRIDQLTPDAFAATPCQRVSSQGVLAGYADGLHTLSACGDVTLIDVKKIEYSRRRHWVNAQRKLRRLLPS